MISTQAEWMLLCWEAGDINKQVWKSRGGRKHHSQLGSWDLEQPVTFLLLLSRRKRVASLGNRSYFQSPSSITYPPKTKRKKRKKLLGNTPNYLQLYFLCMGLNQYRTAKNRLTPSFSNCKRCSHQTVLRSPTIFFFFGAKNVTPIQCPPQGTGSN